jgi:hypothetical protein
MPVEHRKYARYLPQNNAFAALGSKYTRVGKIIDISLGGLAFDYISGEYSGQNSSRVDIFLVGNVFHLYNLPCKMVYDIKIHVPHVNNNFIKILTTKRCGVEFGELSDDNLAKLKLFLQINTTEPA